MYNIPETELNRDVRHDWSKIYELACKELGVQQEKRDKVINLYLILCGFLVPLAFNVDKLDNIGRALLFIIAGIVGLLFTGIVIRYRVYKEVHWITCSTVTKLPYLKNVTKENVQAIFLDTMATKASSFFNGKTLNYYVFRDKNRRSAETFSFMILAFLTSIMLGLGFFLLFYFVFTDCVWISICLGALSGLTVFWFRMRMYMRKLFSVYECLALDPTSNRFKELFNSVFEKAWFLHVYYENSVDVSL